MCIRDRYTAASKGYINSTDCADYLVKKGLPFRDAYKIVGGLVAYCEKNGKELENLTFAEYQEINPIFEDDVYGFIRLDHCVRGRAAAGGPSPDAVQKQIDGMKNWITGLKV